MSTTQGAVENGVRMLKRFWYIPVGLFIIGAVLGPATAGKKSGLETTLRLVDHPGVAFLGFQNKLDNPDFQPSATVLAAQLSQEFPSDSTTTIDFGSNDKDHVVVVTMDGDDSSAIKDKSAAIVKRASELRVAADKLIADSTTKAVAAGRQAILDYLTAQAAPPAGNGGVVIVDRTDAVKQLAELDVLSGTAEQLRDYDGGVTASSQSISPSRATKGLLFGSVLLLAGGVLVFLIAPHGRRLVDAHDVSELAGDIPVLSLSGSDDDIAQSVVAVANRRAVNGAAAFAPVGRSLSASSERLVEHLQTLDEPKLIVTPSFPSGLAATTTALEGVLLFTPLRESRKSDLTDALAAAEASGIPVLAIVTTATKKS